MSGWWILAGWAVAIALLIAFVRAGYARGREQESAHNLEEQAEGFRDTVKAVLDEKPSANELDARNRLRDRKTRKP